MPIDYGLDKLSSDELLGAPKAAPAAPTVAPTVAPAPTSAPATDYGLGKMSANDLLGVAPDPAAEAAKSAALFEASFGNPDEEGKKRKLSSDIERITGTYVAPSIMDFKDAERQQRIAEADHATRASPRTSAFLSNPENAKIAIDDARILAGIEASAKYLARGALNLPGQLTALGGAIMDVFPRPFGMGSELSSMSRGWKGGVNTLVPAPKQAEGVLSEGWAAGLESLGANTPIVIGSLLAFGPAGAAVALPLMAASSGGASAQRAQEKGAGPWTTLGLATTDAVAEYYTEKIGIKYLMDVPGLKNAFLKTAAKFAGAEMAGEQVATVWQDFNEWALLNPEKTIKDFGDERLHAAAVTAIATVVGGGGQITVMKGLSHLLGPDTAKSEAETSGAALLSTMQQAAESLTLKRDPVAFSAFFQEVAGDSTVFVDREQLLQVFAEDKLDINEKLPSAAAQLNQATPEGIEIPVAELVANLSGSGIEEKLVQHLRMEPNAMTIAEGNTKADEAKAFIEHAVEQIMGAKERSDQFVSEVKQIEDDVANSLNAVGAYGTSANKTNAKIMGAWYATVADKWGVTPLQIRDGWTAPDGTKYAGWKPQILGAPTAATQQPELSQGFDHGYAMLNIGLDVGAMARDQQVPLETVKAAIEKLGAKVVSGEVVESEYEYDGKMVKEMTFVPHLDRALTDDEVNQLAVELGQEAIGQYVGGEGKLLGPNAAAWGAFNPEFFKDQTGVSLAEAQKGLKQGAGLKAVDVNSPEFKVWFKDSKVVDADGKPLRVYHGLPHEFTGLKFLRGKSRTRKPSLGFHFGTSAAANDRTAPALDRMRWSFHEGLAPNTMPLYLSVQNPLALRDIGAWHDAKWINKALREVGVDAEADTVAKIQKRLLALGYDGVTYTNTVEDAGSTSYIVFSPEQIKSAISNTGAFSNEDPSILAQSQSARRPTAKKAPEDHLGEVPLTVDYTKIEDDKNEQNMKLVAQYPGIRFKARKADGRVEEFIQHVTNNLLWLHDQIPAEIRQRSKMWYDGARAITDRWTEKYGKSDAQIAAILAVYSPQKDWFMNVSLAERTLDIVQNQQDTAWSPEMSVVAEKILADEKFAMLRGTIEGKKLSELKDRLEQAAWLRTFDEAHNNRGHRLVTPEGGFIEFATSVKGAEKKTGWPGFGTIIKALYVIDDGSPKMIDNALGGEHKVRSFYNNIFHPTSDLGFVTIDTHAVAAGLLRPLSGNSVEVTHNFGGAGTAGSAATGMSGTYAYYQEAYRRAAEARGLLPREMQSITWEAVRELYTMGFKHDTAKMAVVDKLWSEYEKGKRDLESVRAGILNLAGGVEQPSWVGRDSGISPEGWASTYTGELLGDSVPGRDTGTVDRGAGDRAAAGTAGSLYQTAEVRAGSVSGPVTAIHFSKEKRGVLASSMFGTGMPGAERDRLNAASDPRIKQRIAFYVNTGNGITPESGVGTVPHVAELSNLYDADADALKIWRNNRDDLSSAESAVIAAGFTGYLTRTHGRQGAVVLLGQRNLPVEQATTTDVPVAPSAEIPAAKALAMELTRNPRLVSGQQTIEGWKKDLGRVAPETAALVDWTKFEAGKMYRKDDLAATLWQGREQWYFSALEVALKTAPAKVFGSGKAVAQWLRANAGKMGVKSAEIEATGVTDWLETQGKVTQEQVVAFMAQGGVKIEEVVLGTQDPVAAEASRVANTAEVAARKESGRSLDRLIAATGARGVDAANMSHWRYDIANSTIGLADDAERKMLALVEPAGAQLEYELAIADERAWIKASKAAQDAHLKAAGQRGKFEQWQLPGGENYREVLITLPTVGEDRFKYAVMSEDGTRYEGGTFDNKAQAEKLNDLLGGGREIRQLRQEGVGQFRSSHFPGTPNILAHVRLNERTDANGKRVLFIEEIQSDWAQKGRKEGFNTPLRTEGWTAVKGDGDPASGPVWEVRNAQGRWVLGVPMSNTSSAEQAIEHAARTGEQQRGGAQSSVPSAPFVTDTKSWTALALKRMIAYAVENGFDSVAWTTGEQQAARYDLSKQVDQIAIGAYGEGQYQIVARKDGDVVIDRIATDANELESLVGKDIAQKHIETKQSMFKGLDLKVGGEGMKGYYDGIVPQVANDVLKKIGGGKVGTVDLGQDSEPDLDEENGGAITEFVHDMSAQQGFDITPAMREIVSTQGLPLFAGTPKKGSFSPATFELRLLADADLSTFLHEASHFFLAAYTDMAAQPGAPKALVDEVNAILGHLGVADVATWRQMSLDQQRPYHEAWAEQFEQYAMTGKAPSLELDSAFKTFANWLKKIYVSLKTFVATHTGGKLQPDTAAFFDRMLATEEQIATANAARSYTAMFKNAADAGMSDQKFADYMALSKEQTEDAEAMLRSRSLRDMAWLQRTRTKFIAGKQAEAAELRKAVRDEISKDLAATPLRRAARWLKKGEMTQVDGTELKVTAGNKLQISDIEALFPEKALTPRPDISKLGYGQYGMLAAEGLSPDLVAEMFGYRSGEALVRDLLEMKPFKEEVEALTDTRMLEEHSEMLDPNAIAQAADAAIHNDARTRMVATELAALNNKIGSPAALMKAAKAYATQIIETKTSKTLKPWAFAAAETRAGKSALALLRKGKRDEAAEQKRVELVNHTAAKLAYQAEAELKKTIDRFKKIAGYKDDSSAIKSRDAEIVSAIRAILADFGIGTKGKTAREYLAVVQQHNPDLGDALSDVIDSVAANAKDWREMKISELRDLSEEIEGLWFLAKRSKQIEIDGKLITLHEAQQAIYDRLDEIGIPDRVPGEGSAVAPAEKRGILFDRFVGALRRVEAWVGAKDGTLTGPFRQYMWNPIRDAADAYRADKVKYLKAYRDLLAPVAPTFTRRLIDAPEIGYVFGKDEGGMGKTELLHAILHTGNESNKRKLLLGRGWAEETQDGQLNTQKWDTFVKRMHDEGILTKADYDFAQGVWDLLESMKPLAQKAHRDVYGKYFSEVTANAFTNQFGTYAGGYVPAMTDPLIVRDQDLNRLREGEEGNMAYAFPTTAKGFTKGRVEYNKPLKLDLRTLSQHIDKVLLFGHMTRPVNDVRRVMSGKAVAQALGRVDPQAYNTLIMPWLNRAAKQVVETPTPGREGLGRFWSVVRSRAGMAAMFANIANTVQQITGISLAAVRVRPALLMDSVAKYAHGPKAFVEHVTSKSSYMQTRVENEVSAMSTQINEILLNPSVYEQAKEWTVKHSYFLQSAMDNVISPVVWLAGYNQAIEQGLSEGDAVRAGDSAVRETQGSMAPEDIAAFETGSPFYRMFVQFAGYFNMNANLLGTEFVKLSRDMGLKKGAGRGLYVLTLGLAAPAIIGELIIQAFRGGPDDDDKDGEYLDDWLAAVFGYGPLRYVTAMVPGFGTVINATVNTLNNKPYDDRISTAPAISMIESAVKAPLSVYKAIVEDGRPSRAIKDVATLISMSVGLPASGLARPVSYLTDVATGRVEPTGQADLVRGTITGAASPVSKQ